MKKIKHQPYEYNLPQRKFDYKNFKIESNPNSPTYGDDDLSKKYHKLINRLEKYFTK
jgi:hypothetical protein